MEPPFSRARMEAAQSLKCERTQTGQCTRHGTEPPVKTKIIAGVLRFGDLSTFVFKSCLTLCIAPQTAETRTVAKSLPAPAQNLITSCNHGSCYQMYEVCENVCKVLAKAGKSGNRQGRGS